MSVRAGHVVWIANARAGDHCWILLIPLKDGAQMLSVMLVTERRHTVKTVVLLPGDHPFIRVSTSVDYGSARPIVTSTLEEWIQGGRAKVKAPVSAQLLATIIRGARESSRTPNEVKAWLGSAQDESVVAKRSPLRPPGDG